MGITEETYLPTEEELTVQEINLSGPALTAASVHIGKACEFQNNVRLLLPNHLSNIDYNLLLGVHVMQKRTRRS